MKSEIVLKKRREKMAKEAELVKRVQIKKMIRKKRLI